jgi:Peptidase family M13
MTRRVRNSSPRAVSTILIERIADDPVKVAILAAQAGWPPTFSVERLCRSPVGDGRNTSGSVRSDRRLAMHNLGHSRRLNKAALTMGENIADLGGVLLALDAYRVSLNGKPAPVLDGYAGEQRIFIGWAQVWRAKARPDALKQQVASDPHSPALPGRRPRAQHRCLVRRLGREAGRQALPQAGRPRAHLVGGAALSAARNRSV